MAPTSRSPRERRRYSYEYPHPAVTVDGVVFGFDKSNLKVLLVQRKAAPFKGRWALPGGFAGIGEGLEEAIRRELLEETGISRLYLEQLHAFGAPGRDPRERVVSVAYYALVKLADHRIRAASDARRAAWFPASHPPALAFDHAEILAMALKRLRGRIRCEPVGFKLLPGRFPLSELQRLYETILGRPLDKRNFRKKLLGTGLVAPTRAFQQAVPHRAARLYRFDGPACRRLERAGFNSEVQERSRKNPARHRPGETAGIRRPAPGKRAETAAPRT